MKAPKQFRQEQTSQLVEQQEQAQEVVNSEIEKAFKKVEGNITEQGGILNISAELNQIITQMGNTQTIRMINNYCNQFDWQAEFYSEEIDGGWSMTLKKEVIYHGKQQIKITPLS